MNLPRGFHRVGARLRGLHRTQVTLLVVALLAAIAVSAVALVPGLSSPAKASTPSSEQVPGAPYVLPLTIQDQGSQAPAGSSPLTDFPVKVVLTPSNFDYADDSADDTAADASSSDLGFVLAGDSTDTQLPYQVDSWIPGGTSVIWVQVPRLSSAAATLNLYYGDGGIYTGESAANVWANGYSAVNLFNSAGGPSLGSLPTAPQSPSASGLATGTVFPDVLGGSAAGATLQNNGATTGSFESTAVQGNAGSTNAGQAVDLSGSTNSSGGGQFLTLPAADGDPSSAATGSQLTESITVYVPASTETANSYLMTQQSGTPTGDFGEMFFQLTKETTGAQLAVSFYASATNTGQGKITDPTFLTPGWYTITATADNLTDALYVNGVQVSGTNDTARTAVLPQNPNADIFLGEESGSTDAAGSTSSSKPATAFAYSQVSFSQVARTPAWIQADYLSQTNQLVSFGQTLSEAEAPQDVTVDGSGDTATVSWQPPASTADVTGYDVLEGDTPGGESATPVKTVGAGATSATVDDVPAGSQYFTVVTELSDQGGASAPSNEASFFPGPTGAGAVAYYSGTEIALDWSAVTGADSYSVYEGTAPGGESTTPVGCVALTTTSCLIDSLTPNQTYYFTVEANDGQTVSSPSAEVSATTPTNDTSGDHWQLSGAPARVSLSVADDNLTAQLTEFPVKVVLTPQDFNYAADSPDGMAADASTSDLAFIASDDSATTPTQLPYDVDTWNPGGTSVVWVLVPILPEFSPANLELYYGPGGSYNGQDTAAVWSNGYTGVNLFSPTYPNGATAPTDPTSQVGDLPTAPAGPSPVGTGLPTGTVFPDVLGGANAGATLQNNGATTGSFESTAALGYAGATNVGQAVDLSGATNSSGGGQFLTLPASDGDPSADGQLTESMTVYVPQAALSAGSYLMTQQANDPTNAIGEMFFQISSGKVAVSLYSSSTGNSGQGKITDPAGLTPGWHTITATADGTSDLLYVDGVQVGTGSNTTAPTGPLLQNPTAPIFLGEESSSSTSAGSTSSTKPAMPFAYSQVSFSQTARSPAWIQADYQSQSNNLISYGQSQSPTTPLDVALTGTGATGTATVSWQAPIDDGDVTGYDILEGSTSGGESVTPIMHVDASATSATLDNLDPGSSYFTVVADASGSNSLPSNEVSYDHLLPPSTVTATAVSDTSVALQWSSAADASSYSVFQGTGAGGESSSPISCTALTSTSCLVTGLTTGTTYHFTVGDVDGGFASAPSSTEAAATPGSQSAWAVPSAQDRLPIDLNTSFLGSDLTDFPVQVQLPATFDYADASPSTLEFMLGGSSTPLPYQVIHWNPGGMTAVWVQVAQLVPSTQTLDGNPPLYMYYNGVTATPPAASVWDSDFLGVYNFADTNGTTIADATVNANDGAISYGVGSTGTVQTSQQGENGVPAISETAGDDADISFGDLGQGLSHFTYSVSVGVDSTDSGLTSQVGGRQQSTGVAPGEQFAIVEDNGNFVPEIQSGTDPTTGSTAVYQGDGNGGATQTTPVCESPIVLGQSDWTWFNLAMTYDGSDVDFYVNGTSVCTVPFSGPLEPGSLPFSLGSFADQAGYGDFAWSDMRLSDVARSADWIAAESQSAQGPLVTVHSPQVDYTTTGAFIDGTPQVGQTLTADTSGFTPAVGSYVFQWYDNGNVIAGADSSTLALTPALLDSGAVKLGDAITVQITGVGTSLSPLSQPVTLAAGEFTPGTATISGPAQVGGTLTANPGTWSPAGTASYQWLLGGQPIAGATGATYTPTADDFGAAISVEVAESVDGYRTDATTSAPVTIGFGNAVAGTPTISGTVQVGQTVTADAGTWAPVGPPAYQWLLDGNPISGATGATYAITAADAGHQLSVETSEQPAGYLQAFATSAGFNVQDGTFSGGTVTIAGSDAAGSTLTAATGGWSPTPDTVAYQWLLNGQAIPGATSSTYTVPIADAGQQISVTVHVSAGGMETDTATSATITIAPTTASTGTQPVLKVTAGPTVSGHATVGGTVTAQAGSWSESPSSVVYQWLLDGSPIPKATGNTYTITGTAAGHSLSVQVTASASDGDSGTVDSTAVKVAKGALAERKKPAVTGKLAAGKTLKASAGTWSVKPQLVLYQWLRNGRAIKGATHASFKVPAADAHAQLRVRLTVEAAGYANRTVETAVVKNAKRRKGHRAVVA